MKRIALSTTLYAVNRAILRRPRIAALICLGAMARPKRVPDAESPPRQTWALRLTTEARDFLQSVADLEGIPRSVVALRCIEEAKALRELLGPDWFELERQARVEGVKPSDLLGRMAKAALAKGGKK